MDNIMRNFPETGEKVINTKKNSPLRQGFSRVEHTIFLCIDHEFTCLRDIFLLYIQTKIEIKFNIDTKKNKKKINQGSDFMADGKIQIPSNPPPPPGHCVIFKARAKLG